MRTYNPLSVDELGRSAALALMGYEPSVLPPDGQFNGAGVYTIHYDGSFPAYVGMGNDRPSTSARPNRRGSVKGECPQGSPAQCCTNDSLSLLARSEKAKIWTSATSDADGSYSIRYGLDLPNKC